MKRQIRQLLVFVAVCFAATAGMAQDAPRRVVSLNVCTDQLAMLLAKEDQLYSISFLASDPKSSLLHEEAKSYVLNNGQAEEVFLMRPDLIIAGSYTTRSTVTMLKKLGFRVEEFAPENSVEEIKDSIKRMGDLLGNQSKAAQLIDDIDQRLAALELPKSDYPKAAFYYSNSYTAGSGTLMADIAQIAGTKNIADQYGLTSIAYLSLEHLLLAQPDLIVANETSEAAPALAQQNFRHPAYRHLKIAAKGITIDGRLTACGTPFTIDAVEQLNAAALQISGTP